MKKLSFNKLISLQTSVVDPHTLNLDPDPEFWPNLDPESRVMLSILTKNFIIV